MINLFRTSAAMILMLVSLCTTAQSIKYEIRNNGTFDIKGTTINISNCYPALNNSSLKPIKLNITSNGSSKTIQYILIDGSFELNFTYEGNALKIKPTLKTKSAVPDMISILRDAEVSGAEKVYRTSTQILGNGGLIKWPSENWDYSSCGALTGLVPDSGSTMVISTRDFRKYTSYTNAYPTEKYEGRKLIDVCLATEGINNGTFPGFYLTENSTAFSAMKAEANAVGTFMGAKNDKKQSYHWCSWYYAYYHLTDNMLSEYLKGFETLTPRVPIQTIQIDAGYHPHAGDWLEPSHKFPKGIEPSVKEILSKGYKAGIWIGPYMVGNKSKVYLQHPDWVLKNKEGIPIINLSFYAEDRLWGAMDEEIYTLDTSHPEVMEYLRSVFRAFKKMGITFYKTDFMLFGAQNSKDVKRHTPGKTSIEYQREFFDMIRQEIGAESFWLGCIAPFQPMIGYVDGMRISADITPKWEGGTTMFNESKGNHHINNVWWQNDPDAIILRTKYNQMNDVEAKSLILWMGMMGGMINTSDLFYDIPKERTALFRFLEPSDTKLPTTFPLIEKSSKLEVMVRQYPAKNAYAVLFTNRKDDIITATYSLKSIVGLAKGSCFEWTAESSQSLGEKSEISITLMPHESKLIYISSDGKSPQGMNLGGKELK